jgi:glycine/D-amino acid oxidase-like deaminating enzyme
VTVDEGKFGAKQPVERNQVDVLIVGGGFSGLCMALKLREAGMHSSRLLEKQKQFVTDIHRRLAWTVWQSGGCRSWFQDQRTGQNAALWPGAVVASIQRTRTVSRAAYELT